MYKIGDRTVESDSIAVSAEGETLASEYDMFYGLPEMTKFDKMIVNFKNMWIRME